MLCVFISFATSKPKTTTHMAKKQHLKQTVSCQPPGISHCQLPLPAQFTRNALHCDFAIAYEFLWFLYTICRSSFAFFVPTFRWPIVWPFCLFGYVYDSFLASLFCGTYKCYVEYNVSMCVYLRKCVYM